MSQNFQPPTPAPTPYAEAVAPAPARKGNVGLGVVAAVVAGLIAAAAYGGIMYAIDRERSFGAIGIGLLVGYAAGKIGGRSPVLLPVAGLVSIGSVYLGKMFLFALALAELKNTGVTEVVDIIGIGGLNDIVKESMDFMSYVFIGISVLVAVGATKKAND
ncbi:hypothetical protein QEZ40_001559 [Streptomyces katrae]|uniref:Integral membrane protein n=1 Tax=Streptomyces katrae TaxID=68223 RepID=A0ABT7GTL8_9ACTN|nr:hypothetical protein [Streptomyces katrae]MDK9496927.1 hypothetical protein [Streptomyces katrae]